MNHSINSYAPAPMASARRGHRAFVLSVRVYVCMSLDQVKIFVQGMRMYLLSDQQEYTRAMTSWVIFHGPLTLDFARLSRLTF